MKNQTNLPVSKNHLDWFNSKSRLFFSFLLSILSIALLPAGDSVRLLGQTRDQTQTTATNIFDKAAITGRITADGRPLVWHIGSSQK